MQLNTIECIDCMKGLDSIKPHGIDCILTSPPYNTGRKNEDKYCVRYDLYSDVCSNDDYIQWTINLFNKFDNVLKDNGVILYNISYGGENPDLVWLTLSNLILYTPFRIADCIIWKKSNALPNNVSANKLTRICEFVFVICRKSEYNTYFANKSISSIRQNGQIMYTPIYNYVEAKNNDASTDINGATFSSELVIKLLTIYTKSNSIILDPFMGTGTTAVGCILTNRNFIGFEISKKQCIFANKRIQIYKNRTKLLNKIDYSSIIEI